MKNKEFYVSVRLHVGARSAANAARLVGKLIAAANIDFLGEFVTVEGPVSGGWRKCSDSTVRNVRSGRKLKKHGDC